MVKQKQRETLTENDPSASVGFKITYSFIWALPLKIMGMVTEAAKYKKLRVFDINTHSAVHRNI